MEKVTLKTLITSPMKVIQNYNKLVEWQALAEQAIKQRQQVIDQYEADNQQLQQELDCMHLSHDWYVKYEGAQTTIKELQQSLTERNDRITQLEEKVNNQKKQLQIYQNGKMPAYDRRYVRKLQDQLNAKCEKCHELTLRVKQLEGDIIILTLNKE